MYFHKISRLNIIKLLDNKTNIGILENSVCECVCLCVCDGECVCTCVCVCVCALLCVCKINVYTNDNWPCIICNLKQAFPNGQVAQFVQKRLQSLTNKEDCASTNRDNIQKPYSSPSILGRRLKLYNYWPLATSLEYPKYTFSP